MATIWLTGGSKSCSLPAVTSQEAFSARLRQLMSERRMGAPALANQTGINQRTIARYRSGESTPRDAFGPTQNAHALADALGVSVTDLLDAAPEALAS